jgi:parallel beta-helix repeat protein
MRMRGFVTALALASGLVAGIPTVHADTQSLHWDPALNWQNWVSTNPSPDSYGNPGVWSYLETTGFDHQPNTYAPMPAYSTEGEQWYDPAYQYLKVGHGDRLAPTINMHSYGGQESGFRRDSILAWTSPVSGRVRLVGQVTLGDTDCTNLGSGIDWSVDRGPVTIFQELLPSGGLTSFDLTLEDVQPGETLYFIHDPGWDSLCDTAYLTLSIGSPDVSPPLHVTSNTTLTEDHRGSILIDGDNVTLDCAGFRVVGSGIDPATADGIVAAYRTGVTIRNCMVEGFRFAILLDSVGSSRVVENRLSGNTTGVFLADADGNLIAGNEATGNPGSGFDGSDFDWNTFASNTASGNGDQGFNMTRVSHNTFHSNVVANNGGHGFKIFDDTDWNVFDRNRVTGNGMTGLLMYGGYDFNQQYQLQPPDHNTFSRNEIIGNGEGGLYLGWDSTATVVRSNLVLRNREWGIALLRAFDNRVTMNVACQNEIWDAFQEDGSGNVWTANVLCSTSGM